MKLSQATYDTLQWVVRVFIPLFVTFYVGLGTFVPIPYEKEVAGILGLFAVFLGSLLTKSSMDFKKNNEPQAGYLQATGVDDLTGNPDVKLTFAKLPQELLTNETVTLKVGPPPPAMTPPQDGPVSDPT